MSLKCILVHVDGSAQSRATVAAACTLARDHGAHLSALYVEAPDGIPGFASLEIPRAAMAVIESQRKAARQAAREMFDTQAAAAGITERTGWEFTKGSAVGALALRGRYTDIIVVSQSNPETRRAGYEELADDLVMVSGRPVLVIPYIGAPATIGKRALIGWNASREAARAVSDAMPLLEKADSLEILAVEPNGIGDAPGADIALHLARHGIKANANTAAGRDIDVGDVLLNRAADTGVDLIVMGAYGHSRMRELVLGGATRHILEHMTVPVLMSH